MLCFERSEAIQEKKTGSWAYQWPASSVLMAGKFSMMEVLPKPFFQEIHRNPKSYLKQRG